MLQAGRVIGEITPPTMVAAQAEMKPIVPAGSATTLVVRLGPAAADAGGALDETADAAAAIGNRPVTVTVVPRGLRFPLGTSHTRTLRLSASGAAPAPPRRLERPGRPAALRISERAQKSPGPEALRNPARVEIGVSRSVNESVTHAFYPVPQQKKFELLVALLEKTDFQSCIVFSRTKHGADKIARKLKAANHSVAVLHANRSQSQRVEALEGFKSGKYEVMVATDIAARGIDVAGVSHVINYDIPANPEDYVHRIGRTGRAMAVGDAFTLADLLNGESISERVAARLARRTCPLAAARIAPPEGFRLSRRSADAEPALRH